MAWSLAHVHCASPTILYADYADLLTFLTDGILDDMGVGVISSAEEVAKKLSALDIDTHLLLQMSDDELAAIPNIAFGDVIRLKRLVAKKRRALVAPDGGILDYNKDGKVDHKDIKAVLGGHKPDT